jgi:hypothetical protein
MKTVHMKKRDLIPALLRSGTVESDSQREALITRAVKKNMPHISPKTKAILKHQHLVAQKPIHSSKKKHLVAQQPVHSSKQQQHDK